MSEHGGLEPNSGPWPIDVNPTGEHLSIAAKFVAQAGFEMSEASEAIIVREIAELIGLADTFLSGAEVGETYDKEKIIEGSTIRVYGIKTHDGPRFFVGGKSDE